MHPLRLTFCLLAALAACGPAPDTVRMSQEAPPGAPAGTCWHRVIAPAVIETVTEQVVDRPAQLSPTGEVTRPATYRTETRQQIVTPRQERWFETPCADEMGGEFIASLQRALAVRGHYTGPVTARMDARTRRAVQAFQLQNGLDSPVLSLESARSLGLAAVDLDA